MDCSIAAPAVVPPIYRYATPEGVQRIELYPGKSASELVRLTVPEYLVPHVAVFNNGVEIIDPENYFTQHGDNLLLVLNPAGGGGKSKGILGAILSIGLSVFTYGVVSPWASILTGSRIAGTIISAGISFIGNMVISALVAPPKISTAQQSSAPQAVYTFTGQSNAARPYGSVLRLYGRHKLMPLMAANPYVSTVGKTSRITAVYDFGLGHIQIEPDSVKIGDSPAATFAPELVWHVNSLVPSMSLMPARVGYDQMNYSLQQNQPLLLRSKAEANGIEIDISLPQGLFIHDTDATKTPVDPTSVAFEVAYRPLSGGAWQYVSSASISTGGYGMLSNNLISAPRTVWAQVRYTQRLGGGSLFGGTVTLELRTVVSGNVIDGGTVRLRDGRTVPIYQGSSGNDENGNPILVGSPYIVVPASWIWGDPAAGGIQPPNPIATVALTQENVSWVNGFVYIPAVYGSTITLSGRVEHPFSMQVRIDNLPPNTYEIRLTRFTDNLLEGNENKYYRETVVTMVKTLRAGKVVNLDRRHTMVEMRLTASEKLSGVVQNFNAIGTSVIREVGPTGALAPIPSRNPADIAVDMLTSESNARPLPDSLIDWPSWYRLRQYCAQTRTYSINGQVVTRQRHTADFVVDNIATAKDLLESLLSGCRSSLMITGAGKYGVLIDEEKTIPRQLITPENSWGFRGARTFTDKIHALRVSFTDGEVLGTAGLGLWERQEIYVYNDGYNEQNAAPDRIESLGTFGIIDYASAWAFGRYMIAQGVLRSEQFSISMDVENLVVQRGDLVHVAHDTPNIGGVPCRVTSVTGNDIMVSAPLSALPTGYSVRLQSGDIRTGAIIGSNNFDTFTMDNAAGIDVGDLIVLGQLTRVVQPYLVQQIIPGADLTADLLLVKYDAGVYTADIGAIPEWKPGFGDDLIDVTDLEVQNLQASRDFIYLDRYPWNEFLLKWTVTGFGYDHSEVYATTNGGQRTLIGEAMGRQFTWRVDQIHEPWKLGPVTFEVVPISVTGVTGTSAFYTHEVVPERVRPEPPLSFGVNVQDMQISIFWELSPSVDADGYELRYSPDPVSGAWNASQLIGQFGYDINRTTVGARTGKYMIQTIDTSGNRSDVAWQRTTVEVLPNIDILVNVNDQPTGWLGSQGGTITDGTKVKLDGAWGSVNSEGYYYYADYTDLGAIMEARVSWKGMAHGAHRDDVMAMWIPLASQIPLAKASASQWNVQLEYRVSDSVVVMKDWVPLTSALAIPIAGSGSHDWSEWRPIQVGDITARIVQFRIKLESFDPNVNAIVDDGLIEIDVAERTWGIGDVPIPLNGKRILFDPPFVHLEAVAITIDGSNNVDHYLLTGKNNFGFDIVMYDIADQPIAGQIDVMSLGYGVIRSTSL